MSTPPRVFHYHVRKTAGTSLNAAFWRLGGLDHHAMYTRQEAIGNGLRFVGSDADAIAAGSYFYATSHDPAWRLSVPPGTFTVTILRDPVSRVISYYRYLLWARANPGRTDIDPFADAVAAESAFMDRGPTHLRQQLSKRGLRFEKSAIQAFGPSPYLRRLLPPRRSDTQFLRFLAGIPPRHLLTQVHMFSRRFDPREAASAALACSAVCFTESFERDVAKLGASLGLDLQLAHERRLGDPIELSTAELAELRRRLAPEREMVERVRESLGEGPLTNRA